MKVVRKVVGGLESMDGKNKQGSKNVVGNGR